MGLQKTESENIHEVTKCGSSCALFLSWAFLWCVPVRDLQKKNKPVQGLSSQRRACECWECVSVSVMSRTLRWARLVSPCLTVGNGPTRAEGAEPPSKHKSSPSSWLRLHSDAVGNCAGETKPEEMTFFYCIRDVSKMWTQVGGNRYLELVKGYYWLNVFVCVFGYTDSEIHLYLNRTPE